MKENLDKLERKISYLEKFVDELNEVIIEQQKQIDKHCSQIAQLKELMKTNIDTLRITSNDEKPPHY